MLYKRVQEILEALYAYHDIQGVDRTLIRKLSKRFKTFTQLELHDDDTKLIIKVLEQRWLEVRDTALDYTRNKEGINAIWIQLAKEIAKDYPLRTFYDLLFPNIVNKIDPNSFNRISDDTDLGEVYVGENTDSLHLITGLVKHLTSRAYHLSTYRYCGKDASILYPVSIRELTRFKRGQHPFKVDDVHYKSLWSFLNEKVFVNLKNSGELPLHQLSSLLELIESYFNLKENSQAFDLFKLEFQRWVACLLECSIDEINQLYGIKLYFKKKEVYLLELLIDIHEATSFTLDEQLIAILKWLNLYNPAFVIENEAFDNVYRSALSGKHFTLSLFNQLVRNCRDDVHLDMNIKQMFTQLFSLIESSTVITDDMMTQLRAIYSHRWLNVIGTEMDYTRLQSDINKPWIYLAQCLVGAKKIGPNYYQFLMPTLEIDIEPVFGCPVTDYPLSHYVLSEDGTSLILLDVCVKHHQTNGVFSYCKGNRLMSLTPIEIERIQFAQRHLASYYQSILSTLVSPQVSQETIMAVKNLVDGSVYTKGLYYGKYYDQREMLSSATAVQAFHDYYQALDDEERSALNQQRIIYNGKERTFLAVWNAVREQECITLQGKYFIQLVMNYAPYLKFSDSVEDKMNVNEMRLNSTCQTFNNYNLTQDEAENRCQLMFLFIMTHSFQMMPFCGFDVEFWDCKNYIHGVAKSIFDKLNPLITKRDFSHSRFVYAQIMSGIIIPALTNKPFFSRFTAINSFTNMLIELKRNQLFNREFKIHEADQLLSFVLSLRKNPVLAQSSLPGLINNMINTCAQEFPLLDQKLRANILLIKFIFSLDPNQKEFFLNELSQFNGSIDLDHLYKETYKFIVGIVKSNAPKNEGFFSGTELKTLSDKCQMNASSVKEVINVLKQDIYKMRSNLTNNETVVAYLRALGNRVYTPNEAHTKAIDESIPDYLDNPLF